MKIEDLRRPGDDGLGKPPAIPLDRRREFVSDVRKLKTTLTRKALAEKWSDLIPLDQPRTLSNWIRWARGLVESLDKKTKKARRAT